MSLPKQCLSNILHFIRTKKGMFAGVHSPFLYNISTELTGKQWPFYCFSSLNIKYKPDRYQKKFMESIFRLTNYLSPDNVYFIGNGNPMVLLYCIYACRKTDTHLISNNKKVEENIRKIISDEQVSGFNVLNLENPDIYNDLASVKDKREFIIIDIIEKPESLSKTIWHFLNYSHSGTVFVVNDIYRNKLMNTIWKEIKSHSKASACVNFSEFGLIFFNQDLEKRDYYL